MEDMRINAESTPSRLEGTKPSKFSFRNMKWRFCLLVIGLVAFVGLNNMELPFIGSKVQTREQFENLETSAQTINKKVQFAQREKLENTNGNQTNDLDTLKNQLESLTRERDEWKQQFQQAQLNATHLGGKLKKLKKKLKENVHRPSAWETCMGASSLSVNEPSQQGFLSFPPKRNISLEEAFLAENTTVYFLHQRKNGGTSLNFFLLDKYTKVIENETLRYYKSLSEKATSQKTKKTTVTRTTITVPQEDKPISLDEYAKKTALDTVEARTFAPCLFGHCSHKELNVHKYFLGQEKLVIGRHMSYHIPFARSLYEDQVLITNFRSPLKRIESCIKYRFPHESLEVFDSEDFDVRVAEREILPKKFEHYYTCLGEAFRLLTPFDPNQAVEPTEIQKVCCYVKTIFHVIDLSHTDTTRNLTLVESELTEGLRTMKRNSNKNPFSARFEANMAAFIEHIAANNPVVQSEMQLYDCIRDGW